MDDAIHWPFTLGWVICRMEGMMACKGMMASKGIATLAAAGGGATAQKEGGGRSTRRGRLDEDVLRFLFVIIPVIIISYRARAKMFDIRNPV